MFLPTLQNEIIALFAAVTRKLPIPIFVPGLVVDGCKTVRIVSPNAMPETVNVCSVHAWLATLLGVMELVNLSNCSPPLCVVLTRDRVVEAVSRNCMVVPVFQTSPATGVVGEVPAGILSDAADAVDAAKVCLAA